MRPRGRVVLEVRADHPAEQPGADDVVGVGAQVHREDPLPQVLVVEPAAGDVGGERGRRPGVHHVGIADEAAGLAALVLAVAGRCRRRRVERELRLGRQQEAAVVGLALAVERVPDRERDAEEPLPRDQPVTVEPADPVVEPVAHVRRQPLDLRAAADHLLADRGVATAVADVPLAGGDDLERLVALLVEVRHPLRRRRVAVEVACLAQLGDHRLAGGEDGLAGEVGVRRRCLLARQPLRRLPVEPPVAADHRADRQLQLAPPLDVGQVAERAAHRDARALVHLGKGVRDDRDRDAEHRRGDRRTEELLVALVVRVRDQRHGAGDQLGSRRLDVHRRPVGTAVGDPVVVAGVVARLELGLGHRGLEGDVPERRRILQVGLAASQVAQERALADGPGPLADGGVRRVPVDGEPEGAPQRLEDLLVLLDEPLAQGDEVRPADRDLPLGVGLLGRRELRVVGKRRVAPDAVVVLHAPLGRQPVVVPAHRVEHGLAGHPLVAGDQVGVRVGEDVPDVQAAADGGRRCVDRVDVVARLGPVERVGRIRPPALRPLALEALERRPVRYHDCTGVGAGRVRGLRDIGHSAKA